MATVYFPASLRFTPQGTSCPSCCPHLPACLCPTAYAATYLCLHCGPQLPVTDPAWQRACLCPAVHRSLICSCAQMYSEHYHCLTSLAASCGRLGKISPLSHNLFAPEQPRVPVTCRVTEQPVARHCSQVLCFYKTPSAILCNFTISSCTFRIS